MTKRILGIDPGLLHTGWAVIDTCGQTRKYVASGVVLPNPKMEMSERLVTIFREVTKICETFSPDECSMEITFVNKNPKTTLILGHARSAAVVAVANMNVPLFEYEPNKTYELIDTKTFDKKINLLLSLYPNS